MSNSTRLCPLLGFTLGITGEAGKGERTAGSVSVNVEEEVQGSFEVRHLQSS